MFLKNYDLLMAHRQARFLGASTMSSSLLPLKNVNGNAANCSNGDYDDQSLPMAYIGGYATANYAQSTLYCSNNTTPVTYDDYALNNYHAMTLISKTEATPYIEEDYVISSCNFVLNNSNTEDIVINDVMVTYKPANHGSYNMLVYREVLPEPIAVPTGANVVITITKKISLYPNKPSEATVSVE